MWGVVPSELPICSAAFPPQCSGGSQPYPSIKLSGIQETMLLSTCFSLSFTLRGRMAMKAVQSKNMIAIMQPALWVGISPVELLRDEIVYNHYGSPTWKNKPHSSGNVFICYDYYEDDSVCQNIYICEVGNWLIYYFFFFFICCQKPNFYKTYTLRKRWTPGLTFLSQHTAVAAQQDSNQTHHFSVFSEELFDCSLKMEFSWAQMATAELTLFSTKIYKILQLFW